MQNSWLLCPPDYFNVEYEINPWMNIQHTPDKPLARAQWEKLYATFQKIGSNCTLVSPAQGWPDMVFTANAGLVKGNKVFLSTFRYKERQGETLLFRNWFEQNGYECFISNNKSFEGEGDALFAGNLLFGGYGFRSDRDVFEEIVKVLNIQDLVLCELINPSFYHLDTCFCPINTKEALCVLNAFTKETIKRLESKINLIPLTENDAKCFGCNAVVIGNSIILPSGCRKLPKILKAKGFSVYEVGMSEFMKAGGAAKCLSLKLK